MASSGWRAMSELDPALVEADYVVDATRNAIRDGNTGLSGVPQGILKLIHTGYWKDRIVQRTGERVTFDSFETFVITPPIKGLGSSIRQLEGLCRDDKAALDALDLALQRPAGHPPAILYNIQDKAPSGTSEQAGLRRLRRDRPDLHERVLAGEMSVHAAMLEAGFRKPTLTVPADPQAAARRLWRRYSPEEREAFIASFGPA